MRKLFFILLLIIPFFGLSQSVISPSASTYTQNTSGQSAAGFSLSNFNSTSTLLVTIGLVNPPSGVTLSLTTTTGLSLSTGYSSWSNFTRISFTGLQSNINTALTSLKVNTGSVPGNVYIAVTATENPTGYYYLPTNGHFYRPISGAVSYTTAKSNAATQTFKGQTGYLITITSQDEQNFVQNNVPGNNIWFALSDVGQEGTWKIDAGPENGTTIWTASTSGLSNSVTNSYSSAGVTSSGQYAMWCGGEPNNADGSTGEDHAVTKWGGGTCWNDLRDGNSGGIGGYVVEFGTWTDPANQTFTNFYTGFVTNQISCNGAQTPTQPTAVNSSRIGVGTVTISATVGSGLTVDWYSNSTGGNPILSNNTNYTTPNISTTTKYYAQSRNTTTGCISSNRTEVIATVIISEKISGIVSIPTNLPTKPQLKLYIVENSIETLIDSVVVNSDGSYTLNPTKYNSTYRIYPSFSSYTLTLNDFNLLFDESKNVNTPTMLAPGLVLNSGLKMKAGDMNQDGIVDIRDTYLCGAAISGYKPFNKVAWFTPNVFNTLTINNFGTVIPLNYFTINFTNSVVTQDMKYLILGDTDLSLSSQ